MKEFKNHFEALNNIYKPRNVIMEKMTKKKALINAILEELTELKMHFCNERSFEAGVGLGRLIASMYCRLDLLEEDEHDEDEDDEDYDQNDDIDYEFLYKEKGEELRKAVEIINKNISCIDSLKNIIKDLIKNDHIYPGKIHTVINSFIKCCPDETEEGLYGLQMGITMRMK